jgi:hypothetical protein
MKTDGQMEEDLDRALAAALREDPLFARWFLDQTPFAGLDARCVEVRADNPWSRVKLNVTGGADGSLLDLVRDAETDVLAVYVTSDERRIALHIENKLAHGSFTAYQPESYRARLAQWQGRLKLGMYVDARSVLIAPRAFYAVNRAGANQFDAYVPHETLAEHVPLFGKGR